MRVIHICTTVYDSTAAVRQHAELIKCGIESYIITLENHTSFYNKNIIVVKPSKSEKIINEFREIVERIRRKTICHNQRNMPYSFPLKNVNIKKYIDFNSNIYKMLLNTK